MLIKQYQHLIYIAIMPSNKYVKMSSKGGYLPSTKCSKNGGMTVGGAVPLLLNKILKQPIQKGGSLISKTNQAVGIITAPPTPVMRGGELLNALSNISFDKNVKKNKRDNIKFIF